MKSTFCPIQFFFLLFSRTVISIGRAHDCLLVSSTLAFFLTAFFHLPNLVYSISEANISSQYLGYSVSYAQTFSLLLLFFCSRSCHPLIILLVVCAFFRVSLCSNRLIFNMSLLCLVFQLFSMPCEASA